MCSENVNQKNPPTMQAGAEADGVSSITTPSISANPKSGNVLNLPSELRERPQWCLANSKKAPCIVKDGELIPTGVNSPNDWLDFETATEQAEERDLNIGFMLTSNDPFICIDLDVKDADNEPDVNKHTTPEQFERFATIIEKFDSYTEFSQSGKGWHVWCTGGSGSGVRRDGVEVYSQERFIICTGNALHAKPIHERSELIATLVAEIRRAQGGSTEKTALVEQPQDYTDAEIWERATSAANGQKFIHLCNGEWDRYEYESASEADLSLMSMFAFYSRSNEQCRRMFRQTRMKDRPKGAKITKNDYYLNKTLSLIRGRQANECEDQADHIEFGRQMADNLIRGELQKRLKAQYKVGTSLNSSLTAKPLRQFLKESEPIEFLIDDVCRRGWLYAITGSTGSGKTGIAVSLALCVASGMSVGSHNVTIGGVLYIAGENPDDVRGRFIASLKQTNWGEAVLDNIHIIDQSFLLAERINDLEQIIDELGPAVIIVDTDQAVSLDGNQSEIDNGARMMHAKNLRRMTRRESRPTVLDLCHPNAAATKDSLVPRGGSSFLNEIDGNIRCWRDEAVATLGSDPNKFRGSAFELSFRKNEIYLEEMKDMKGRTIAVPVFMPATDIEVTTVQVSQLNEKQCLLKTLMEYPGLPQVQLLERLGWKNSKGELDKPKISKMLKSLRENDPALVNGDTTLTREGKKQARGLN